MRNGTTAHTVKLARHGVVESVNVGVPRTVMWRGDAVTTSIWKAPVDARVHVHGINIAGDDQADRAVHGGVDKAVYSYSTEDYDWWSEQLGYPLEPGTFGDNLTVRGVTTTDAVARNALFAPAFEGRTLGERWRADDGGRVRPHDQGTGELMAGMSGRASIAPPQ